MLIKYLIIPPGMLSIVCSMIRVEGVECRPEGGRGGNGFLIHVLDHNDSPEKAEELLLGHKFRIWKTETTVADAFSRIIWILCWFGCSKRFFYASRTRDATVEGCGESGMMFIKTSCTITVPVACEKSYRKSATEMRVGGITFCPRWNVLCACAVASNVRQHSVRLNKNRLSTNFAQTNETVLSDAASKWLGSHRKSFSTSSLIENFKFVVSG